MLRAFCSLTLVSTVLVGAGYGRDRLTVSDDKDVLHGLFVTSLTPRASQADFHRARFTSQTTDVVDAGTFISLESPWSLSGQPIHTSLNQPVIRGQSPSGAGGGGGGASAAAATDPSAMLTQFQIQNVFTPETYDASGYSNTVILQPVLPFPVAMPGLKDIFPNHIIRPTHPIISPTADPDGPLGVEGGLGDLTLLDAFVHPVEGFGNLLFGYTAIFPTATDEQLGLQEWLLGPSAAVVYKEIPQTLLGIVYQQPFSLESDAQQVLIQPV